MDDDLPRAVARGRRAYGAIVALVIVGLALALVARMVGAGERGADQLMSAASAATRSTE
jgi:hypothetical protein